MPAAHPAAGAAEHAGSEGLLHLQGSSASWPRGEGRVRTDRRSRRPTSGRRLNRSGHYHHGACAGGARWEAESPGREPRTAGPSRHCGAAAARHPGGKWRKDRQSCVLSHLARAAVTTGPRCPGQLDCGGASTGARRPAARKRGSPREAQRFLVSCRDYHRAAPPRVPSG